MLHEVNINLNTAWTKQTEKVELTWHDWCDFGISSFNTVKPLILNKSKEFMKCRLDNFSMDFILFYVNLSIYKNKAPYNHLIKKLNICNIPLSESKEYDIWYGLTVVRLHSNCSIWSPLLKKPCFKQIFLINFPIFRSDRDFIRGFSAAGCRAVIFIFLIILNLCK